MNARAYPTYEGIPLSTSELTLPDSALDLTDRYSFNNHHLEFTARSFGRFLISKTLRDLEGMQEEMPKDVHAELHRQYEPPAFPTIRQAMARVAVGYENGEQMKVYDLVQKKYVYQNISPIHMKQMEMEFNRLAA